jgi:acetyltransferase-like isoleucine patch superfamily enzyme
MLKLIAILAIPLPQFMKRWVYRRLLGWSVAPTARVGLSFVHAKHAQLGEHTNIGHFNVIRNLELLELGAHAFVGNRNYISAEPFNSPKKLCHAQGRKPGLILGEHAAITGTHFIDCNDLVSIGEFSLLAGKGTFIYTHGIDVRKNEQTVGKVRIGKYCMVGARCMIVKGAELPDCSVLAAQSMLQRKMSEPYGLYSGNPATMVRRFDENAGFFTRTKGFVD